jgi:hypothetical protein
MNCGLCLIQPCTLEFPCPFPKKIPLALTLLQQQVAKTEVMHHNLPEDASSWGTFSSKSAQSEESGRVSLAGSSIQHGEGQCISIIYRPATLTKELSQL